MNSRSEFMQYLRDNLGGQLVAFRVNFTKYLSINSSLLLCQLLYWAGDPKVQQREGWFYKSVSDLESETGLSKYQQKAARDQLVHSGLIEAKLCGIPKIWHYRVCIEAVIALGKQGDDYQSQTQAIPLNIENIALGKSPDSPNIGEVNRSTLGEELTQFNKESKITKEIPKSIYPGDQIPESLALTGDVPGISSPEIQLFRRITGRYPRKDQFSIVIKLMSSKSYDDLKPFWEAWVKRDYRRTNLGWLDWVVAGRIPDGGRFSQGNTKTNLNAPIHPESSDQVLAEFIRLNPKYVSINPPNEKV